jgi:SAM-dependent methyltransferase
MLGAMESAYSSFDPESEKSRLRLQAEVLEPLGARALDQIRVVPGAQVVDVGCGAMGLLRVLSRRVGPSGRVVGSDSSPEMLAHARVSCDDDGLANVELVQDDLFASRLPAGAFDLVHARFLFAPLGRDAEIAAALERLARPDGVIFVEEPDRASWQVHPDGEAHDRLIAVIGRAYERHMGGFSAGRRLPALARARAWRDVGLDAQVVAMGPGHPYLRAPLMMAASLRVAILRDTPAEELDRLVADATALYERPDIHGLSFTVMQVWGRPSL